MSYDNDVIHSYQISTAPLFTRVNLYSCRIGFNCLLLYRLLASTTPSRNHKLKLFTTWYLGHPAVCTDYNYSVQLVYIAAIPNRKSASEWKSCLAMYRSIYLNIRQDGNRIYLRTHQKLEAYYQFCFLSFCQLKLMYTIRRKCAVQYFLPPQTAVTGWQFTWSWFLPSKFSTLCKAFTCVYRVCYVRCT